jgi:hypothetical protein
MLGDPSFPSGQPARLFVYTNRCSTPMADCEDNSTGSPVHGDGHTIAPALGSFSTPLDSPDSPFYAAPGRTVDETWNYIRGRMANLLAALGSNGVEEIDISADRLRADHQQVFGDLFPADAGRFRWKRRGKWEVGVFGIGPGSGPQSPRRSCGYTPSSTGTCAPPMSRCRRRCFSLDSPALSSATITRTTRLWLAHSRQAAEGRATRLSVN